MRRLGRIFRWLLLLAVVALWDSHPLLALGAASERERIKVVSREDMIAAGREAAEEFRASA